MTTLKENLKKISSIDKQRNREEKRSSRKIRKKLKKFVCVENCDNTKTSLYYCKICDQGFPICKPHFANRHKTKKCVVCGKPGITRRWNIPLPLSLYKN